MENEKAAFTPGPWVKDRHEQLFGDNGKQIGVWNAGIAFVSRDDEAEANARLIAAAPELYEALEEVAEWLDGDEPILERVLGALAKARGEQ